MSESVRSARWPWVRVEEAALVANGGPGRFVITHLARADEVADAAAAAGAVTEVDEARLRAVATPSRLVDAAGRVGGAELAEPLRLALEHALAGWRSPAPDIVTPAGVLACSQRALVMGIVNVTPDSFSDGGDHFDAGGGHDRAIDHGRALLAEGADIIDVGGESTRPGAEPVDADEELRRTVPVVEALAAEGAVVSIDTGKAVVARRAVAAGAALVNDVTAGSLDDELLPTVAELDVPYVLMHMRGTPRTMQHDPRYDDVVADVFDFLAELIARLRGLGVREDAVIVDPGIGFGKTLEHNLQLLRRVREFTSLGRPVLVGASRKTFLGRLMDVEDASDRLEGSLVTAADAVRGGASIVRVHDVAPTVRALAVAQALRDRTAAGEA